MQKKPLRTCVSREEYSLLQRLRDRKPAQNPPKSSTTLGDRLADKVVSTVGSWRFVTIQSILLLLWIILNITAYIQRWDPYPFILLNLMLSFQAAYTAPIIMMSQNRQSTIDRQDAKYDYEVNQKAELEIELLHDSVNLLREEEISEMIQLLKANQEQLQIIESKLSEISTRLNNN
jgi:uncharacterized membrane protein